MRVASWQSFKLQILPVPMNGRSNRIFLAGRLQIFDRVECIQNELELPVAAGAGSKMFFDVHQQAVEQRTVETHLSAYDCKSPQIV